MHVQVGVDVSRNPLEHRQFLVQQLTDWGLQRCEVPLPAFVDRILGGDMQFSKLSSPPELEPHYLLDKDEP